MKSDSSKATKSKAIFSHEKPNEKQNNSTDIEAVIKFIKLALVKS